MLSNTVLALSLLPVTFAHFQLNWPAGRGFSEDTEGTFPCGGYNDVQQQRTDFPINGAPIQLHMVGTPMYELHVRHTLTSYTNVLGAPANQCRSIHGYW